MSSSEPISDSQLALAHLNTDDRTALAETWIEGVVPVACGIDRRLNWKRGKATRIYRKMLNLGILSRVHHGHYRLTDLGKQVRRELGSPCPSERIYRKA
ncbi:hypothetical protein CKO28_01170 [Rhodovibrio sodomensis]|uniref:Restriction system protein Mrr-like N-terminal domain-containing protein n=1 Tax=Rhodovibrio sodomensis TaxID=1088 RepID=A0ABS1D8B2_9PROT|nr:hypothetical protein [Rhodovibrio sodomensis]MBK1666654.1 hypothetical protein [Rhodovibrio sodomensis]